MRATATAVTLAIAASLVAGQESGKSGKSGTSKSSKSGDCTDCSTATLTRATTLTNLYVGNLANDDNVINTASIANFCSKGPEATAAFLQASDNTVGCLDDSGCLFYGFSRYVKYTEANFTEGFVQALLTSGQCFREQNDAPLRGGCADPCETIINGGGGLLGNVDPVDVRSVFYVNGYS